MIFREIRPKDVPAVMALRFSTVENAITESELAESYGLTLESIADSLTGTCKGWLCESDAAVLGFSIGDSGNGEVQVVAVDPSAEGRGVGREVLRRVVTWLFFAGHSRVWLRANPDPDIRATGFYRHLGWRPTGAEIGGETVLALDRETRRQRETGA